MHQSLCTLFLGRSVWTNSPESSSKVSPETGIGVWMALPSGGLGDRRPACAHRLCLFWFAVLPSAAEDQDNAPCLSDGHAKGHHISGDALCFEGISSHLQRADHRCNLADWVSDAWTSWGRCLTYGRVDDGITWGVALLEQTLSTSQLDLKDGLWQVGKSLMSIESKQDNTMTRILNEPLHHDTTEWVECPIHHWCAVISDRLCFPQFQIACQETLLPSHILQIMCCQPRSGIKTGGDCEPTQWKAEAATMHWMAGTEQNSWYLSLHNLHL